MLGLILVFAVLALIFSAALVALFLGVERTQTQVNLDSNDSYEIRNFSFNKGVNVEGSILIESQADKDVLIWVTNPVAQTIVNLGRISGNTTFTFTTSDSGIYTFYFDSGFDLLNSKSITLSFIVEVGILGLYASFSAWIAVFIGMFLALIAGYFLFRMRRTEKYAQTEIDRVAHDR